MTKKDTSKNDWLLRLERYGISRHDFDQTRDQLSKQLGERAGVNDTVWRTLNNLVLKFGSDFASLEHVYREMASLVSSEGRDPTQYLLEAERVREKWAGSTIQEDKKGLLGHDELAYVRKLRNEGKLDQAEIILKKADPSPAVLDEIRKIASSRARQAKKDENWVAVVQYLEGYNSYASQHREYCIKLVNQPPPTHTKRDIKLLQDAKAKLPGHQDNGSGHDF